VLLPYNLKFTTICYLWCSPYALNTLLCLIQMLFNNQMHFLNSGA
jgi:hypothetical protein